ncbi:MAG: hypothetical protein LBB43_05070, partial [Spirochaetaceae bacterium]|nr:hypothetical protein [Spirochaetaceae bacterium]
MARSRNWFPRNRAAQLMMWNIPASVLTELHARTSAAETALTEVQNEDIRTPVAAAQCREGFRVLEEGMRDIKKRYFYVPPLQESDLVSLGLKIH